MFQSHRIGALLLMGGEGKRYGGEIPKQFLFLENQRIYQYPLQTLEKTGWFDEILLVTASDWIDDIRQELPLHRIIPGGKTRQESSSLGLNSFAEPPDIVLIHDAVRPFVSPRIIEENLLIAIEHGAVDTCIASRDTLIYSQNQKTVDHIPERSHFLRGQTPQTFRFSLILEAHKKTKQTNASDDCRLVLEQGNKVYIVEGEEKNLKITTPFDFWNAKSFLEKNQGNIYSLPDTK